MARPRRRNSPAPDRSRSGHHWLTYGSFWDIADGRDGETETASVAVARRRLRAAAPALLRRLDFNPGRFRTGIRAPSRRDLVRMLRILGIRE